MAEHAKPSESLEFPVSSTQKLIADMVIENTATGRYRAINAILHLNRGWKLRDIDNEMGLFRAITAEEEAATAVFMALKFRHYANAKKLNQGNHLYKNALAVFIIGIRYKLGSTGRDIGSMRFVADDKNHLQIEMHLKDDSGIPMRPFTTKMPLDIVLTESLADGPMTPLDFRSYLANAFVAEGSSIKKVLKEKANIRNLLLYAVDEGYHKVESDFEKTFEACKRNTFINLATYLMIIQPKGKQTFVQDALNSFVEVLDALSTRPAEGEGE